MSNTIIFLLLTMIIIIIMISLLFMYFVYFVYFCTRFMNMLRKAPAPTPAPVYEVHPFFAYIEGYDTDEDANVVYTYKSPKALNRKNKNKNKKNT